jgi:uncharacterized protein (TIGR02996 family)
MIRCVPPCAPLWAHPRSCGQSRLTQPRQAAHNDGDTRKLVYADWLEEQGNPRSEYLRLMVKVRQEQIVTPEQRQRHNELSRELAELHAQERQEWENALADRGPPPRNRERERRVNELERQLADLSRSIRRQIPARLQELAATLDPKWLAVVSDPEIEGCGKNTGGAWRPRFDFVCDKSWADMKPTGDDNVRHCEACSRDVHFCDTLADAREHSHEGHCIAVDLGVIRRKDDLTPPMLFAGQPSKEDLRRSYEQEVDPVSQARLDARKSRARRRRRG